MASRKPHKTESVSSERSISKDVSDWLLQLSKQLEDGFIELALEFPEDAPIRAYQDATIRAMFSALLDSGMDPEAFAETAGQVLLEKRTGSIEWNSRLNQRRFELIDKEIQETLTAVEGIELAGLTRIMREQVDSEAVQPMDGAKALHRMLLELGVKDKRS